MGENTMLDGLGIDETFTHQMKLLHAESFRYKVGESVEEPRT